MCGGGGVLGAIVGGALAVATSGTSLLAGAALGGAIGGGIQSGNLSGALQGAAIGGLGAMGYGALTGADVLAGSSLGAAGAGAGVAPISEAATSVVGADGSLTAIPGALTAGGTGSLVTGGLSPSALTAGGSLASAGSGLGLGSMGQYVAGANLVSGLLGAQATKNAAQLQATAASAASAATLMGQQDAIAAQTAMYQNNVAQQTPYMQAGYNSLGNLMTGMGSNGTNGPLTQAFSAKDLTANMAPNYAFTMNAGMQGVNAANAASGLTGSGQGITNAINQATNIAQGSYQQAYNNYVTNQTNQYNRLSGIAGLGQSAAAGVGNSGTQTGANIANTTMAGTAASNNYLTSGAAAQAAGQVGSANAISGALNNGMNQYTTMSYLNNLQNSQANNQLRVGLS